MLTVRTKPAVGKLTPSQDEMKEVAQKVGLNKYSPSLVADFCHIAEGGTFLPPSTYREKVRQGVIMKVEADNKTYSGSRFGIAPKSKQEDIDQRIEKMMRYHSRVSDFVREVPLDRFPGSNPLEKAMALLKLLSKQDGGSGGGSGESEESLPIFSDKSADEISESLEEILDLTESLSEAEQDMIDPQGEGHELEEKADGQRSGSGLLQALKIAEKLAPGSDERKILEISRLLDTFTQMETRKQKNVIADPASDKIRRRQIKHMGELSKLTSSEWAKRAYLPRPYWNYLALSGGLQIKERYEEEEKKQAILVLLDGSGSMRGSRHTRATGVIMNRLLAVVEGEAEVYLGVFDTDLEIVGEAKTPAEARELIQKFRKGNFRGGGTNIAKAVKEGSLFIEQKIKDGEALWRPEIVVLTDEDSSTSGITASDVPGTKVHGFAIGVKNPNLVKFAQSTGGIGVEDF